MHHRLSRSIVLPLLLVALVLPACSTFAPPPTPTSTPQPTATTTNTPTITPSPTSTPKPTATPNLAATAKAEELQAEVQSYFDQGYLSTTDGSIKEVKNFSYEWAQLGWYRKDPLNTVASDFFISGHFKWSSAYKNADISGCGYVFALQEDSGDHYAMFLDRSRVLFLITSDHRGRIAGPTRGNGKVKFDNPADKPAEADFTVIVNDHYVYALVDGALVGEYTLAQSRGYEGRLALTVLSGTNKDYGTRCQMTNLHIWTPK